MAAASIDLANVGKLYGTLWAVRGVTLNVAPGEFFTLLGPSGCGKTTVLRMIAGFVAPDAGQILLDGASVAGVPPWRRDLGLVFQHYALWPHLTVFEHAAFGLRERRLPRDEIRQRVAATLAMVGLDGLEARRPSQLSGGQQQRVALARTLVLRPRALLLDEPLSNLDARLRAQMRVELRRLHQELGITTVYVTHDQEEALALSTRVAVFDRGEVIQVGTPAEVYRRPRTRFVAEFLGAANLLPGRLETGPSGPVVRVKDGLTLTVANATVPAGGPVFCLVRPEAIQRAPADARHPNRIFATVASVVYLGGRWDCELALAGGLALRAEMPAAAGAAPPRPGELVTVIVPPEDIIVLPA
ncbi:MAG: ABC transporter ATP-binding protein [Candidatus Rokubacteria bacterium]|nr:ABC transporter ATP-binding protein [Candidatus Rokubacteria bacterium]